MLLCSAKLGFGLSIAMIPLWCSTILVVPLVAITVPAIWIAATYGPPPSDYGSGSMFDKIATRYDLINRVLALNLDTQWRVQMVKAVTDNGELFVRQEANGGAKILDLATGTADVAILVANEASSSSSSSASVLGIDPSENMISVGREKVKAHGLDEVVTLQIGDARKLTDLKSSEYDAATMAFGIRNVPEKADALCEIWRVLKKKDQSVHKDTARLAILEFSEPGPETGILGALARLFIRHVVPVMGAALSGAPKEYLHLQNSIKEFPSPSDFKVLMEGLQCSMGDNDIGAFTVEEIRQMNFGSVQLYLARPYTQ